MISLIRKPLHILSHVGDDALDGGPDDAPEFERNGIELTATNIPNDEHHCKSDTISAYFVNEPMSLLENINGKEFSTECVGTHKATEDLLVEQSDDVVMTNWNTDALFVNEEDVVPIENNVMVSEFLGVVLVCGWVGLLILIVWLVEHSMLLFNLDK